MGKYGVYRAIKPEIGKSYTIIKGDTLWDIANFVYGSGWKYTVIWDANKSVLKSGDPNLIYPGEVIWIPPATGGLPDINNFNTEPVEKTSKVDPYAFRLIIDGINIPVISGSCTLTFDSPYNMWVAKIKYRQDSEIYDIIKPFQYKPSKLYLGNNYIGDTVLYTTKLQWNSKSSMATITGYTKTVDIVDSVSEAPFQATNTTLEKWAKKLCEPFGVNLVYEPTKTVKLKRVKIGKTESISRHLAELVQANGFRLTCDEKGSLVIADEPKVLAPSMSFTENESTSLTTGEITFDGRKQFKKIIGYTTKPRKHITYTHVNENLRCNRIQAVVTNDPNSEDDLIEAVGTKARNAVDAALTFVIPTRQWYNEQNELFKPGQFVTVRTSMAYLVKTTTLIIKAVEFLYSAKERSCNLRVTPASVYIKSNPIPDPWDNAPETGENFQMV